MSSLLRTCSENDLIVKASQVKDLFNISHYIGNESTLAVDTDLNLSTGHCLVKIKNLDTTSDHVLYDSKRGFSKEIYTNKTSSEITNLSGLTQFSTTGFSLGNSKNVNKIGNHFSAITFKKAEKFFDIVQYTGDGTANRSVFHSLNCTVGLISIKALDVYSNWFVRHKDATGELINEQPYKQTDSFTQITEIASTYFKVSNNANLLGVKYVAYIYAHDSRSSGKIQCGIYTGGYQDVLETVTGVGKLYIPDDVKEIMITCKGGTGGNNTWFDPGQPYVVGTPEQKFIAPIYAWNYVDDYTMTTAPITSLELWNSISHTHPLEPLTAPTKISDINDATSIHYVEWWLGTMDNPIFRKGHYSSYLVDLGQPFIAAVPDQPYKAPTSGGSVYSGDYSKVTINDIVHVFDGGNAGPATPQTFTLTLNDGLNRVISYDIGKGGSLTYGYKTGGNTDVAISFTLPSTNFSTTLYNKGSLTIPKNIKTVNIACSGGRGRNDTYISFGQPEIAPSGMIDPGQSYVEPTYDPGQSYIAPKPYDPGIPAIAPSTTVVQPYFAPYSWDYSDWYNPDFTSPPYFFRNINVFSENMPFDFEDYAIYNEGTDDEYKIYAFQAPGSGIYRSKVGSPNYGEWIVNVPSAITRVWRRRWKDSSGVVHFTDVNQKYNGVGSGNGNRSGGTITDRGRVGVPETPADPGRPYIAPFMTDPGRPYIAPTYTNPGQPYIAPVYCNPGQPYIGPTAFDPGQPEIAYQAPQPAIPAKDAVDQVGFPEHPNGLLPYVAPVAAVPERVVPATWKYTNWLSSNSTIRATGVTTEEVQNEVEDYIIFNEGQGFSQYTQYSWQAPGAPLYSDNPLPGPSEPKGYVPALTDRLWSRRWKDSSGVIHISNFYQTWHAQVTIPAKATVAQVGDPDHPDGLPRYVPGSPAVAAQEAKPEIQGQPYIAPTPSHPGQQYVPPVIGVGDIVGDSSYISINDKTFTYLGSLGYSNPSINYNTLSLNGDNSQNLIYNLASTGHLTVSYDIPNYDILTQTVFKPLYLLVKKLTDEGDWYEIDCRKPSFNLKENKSDQEVFNEIITINNNGFTPKSVLLNELGQKYIYMIIRE